MASNTRLQLESWLKTINVKTDRVADVGGLHLPVKGRTKSWEVNKYEIIDIETNYKGLNSDYVYDLNEKLNPTEAWGENDIVFCLEVMEYIYNPIQFLQNLNILLVQNGILYISTHYDYPIHHPKNRDYLRYTPIGIVKMLEKTGFKIIENTPRDSGNLIKAVKL